MWTRVLAVIFLIAVGVLIALLFAGGVHAKGIRAFGAGEYDAAATAFERAVARNDHPYESRLFLARIAGIRERYEDGLAECDAAIALKPKGPMGLYYKIILLQLAGRYQESEKLWDALSNMGQVNAGFMLAQIANPRPGGGSAPLTEPEKATRIRLLQE